MSLFLSVTFYLFWCWVSLCWVSWCQLAIVASLLRPLGDNQSITTLTTMDWTNLKIWPIQKINILYIGVPYYPGVVFPIMSQDNPMIIVKVTWPQLQIAYWKVLIRHLKPNIDPRKYLRCLRIPTQVPWYIKNLVPLEKSIILRLVYIGDICWR